MGLTLGPWLGPRVGDSDCPAEERVASLARTWATKISFSGPTLVSYWTATRTLPRASQRSLNQKKPAPRSGSVPPWSQPMLPVGATSDSPYAAASGSAAATAAAEGKIATIPSHPLVEPDVLAGYWSTTTPGRKLSQIPATGLVEIPNAAAAWGTVVGSGEVAASPCQTMASPIIVCSQPTA